MYFRVYSKKKKKQKNPKPVKGELRIEKWRKTGMGWDGVAFGGWVGNCKSYGCVKLRGQ